MYNNQRILTVNDLNRNKLPDDLKRKLDSFDEALKLLANASSQLTEKFIRSGVKIIDSVLADELNRFVHLNSRFISLYQNHAASA